MEYKSNGIFIYMKDKWFKFTVFVNYYINVYPWRSVIIILGLFITSYILFMVWQLLVPLVITTSIFMFFITIRTFSGLSNNIKYFDESKNKYARDILTGVWLKYSEYQFIKIEVAQGYHAIHIYSFDVKPNPWLPIFSNENNQYRIFNTTWLNWDFSQIRWATRREYDKYNLAIMDSKIALLQN